MTQLVAIESITPAKVFSDNGLDPLLERIEKEARSMLFDISTEKGRKELASFAYKIAQSKTALDKMGKELVSEWKEKSKKVDAERSRAWVRLEALQKEIRKPLTDWENKEKERTDAHEAALAELAALAEIPIDASASDIQARLDRVTDHARDWEEFCVRAEAIKKAALAQVTARLEARRLYEAEQAELARLLKEEAARKQREHEERLQAEAAAKATAEAEEKARKAAEAEAARVKAEQDRLRIQREKDEAEARAKKAEEDRLAALANAEAERLAAAERAKQDAELAAQREREKIAAEQKAEEEAAAKREADKQHRGKVNREALAALVKAGVPEDAAKKVIEAIAKKVVPHVSIQY